MGYVISNIYVITTVAVIGGALFGFDIASMSAMYVFQLCPNHLITNLLTVYHPVLELNNTSASSTRPASRMECAVGRPQPTRVVSRLPCPVAPLSVRLFRAS